MQKLKRDRGNTFNSILPNLLCIIVTMVFVMLFTSWIANITHRQELNSICRKYILQMESTGYLTDNMRANLEAELVSAGMTNVSIDTPTTLKHAKYGEDINLKVTGKMPVYNFSVRGMSVDKDGNKTDSTNKFLEIIAGTSSWDVTMAKSSISKAPDGTTIDVNYIQIVTNVINSKGGAIYYNNEVTKGVQFEKGKNSAAHFTIKAAAGYEIDEVYVNSEKVDKDPMSSDNKNYSGQSTAGYTFPANLEKSQTLVVKFRPKTVTYKVYHYKQDLNGSTYTLADTDTLSGKTDETVVGGRKSYEGFEQPDEQSVVVKADGSSYIQYRYNRKRYSFKIDKTKKYGNYVDTSSSLGTSSDGTYLYGATIKLNAKISTPSNIPSEIFTLNGWDGDKSTSDISYSFTMPANNITVYPLVSISKYTLSFDNNGGTGKINDKTNLTYFDEITLPKDGEGISKDGYELVGWSLNKNGAVNYNPGQVVKGLTTKSNLTLYAVWNDLGKTTYKIDHYVMDKDGAYQFASSETKDGFASSTRIPVENLINNQYVSKGVTKFDHAENNGTIISDVSPNRDGTTVINMYYSREQYTITASMSPHAYMNGSNSYTARAYVGQSISLPINLDNGYKLLKAEVTSGNVSDFNVNYSTNIITFTMPSQNVALRVNHGLIKYKINYNIGDDARFLKDNPVEYDVETATFKLNNPVREHYTFIGWTGTNLSSAQLDVSISKGTTGDINLTALWLIDSYNVTIKYPGDGGSIYVNSSLVTFDEQKDYTFKLNYGQALNVKFVPNAYETLKYVKLTTDNESPVTLVKDSESEYEYQTKCMEHNLVFDSNFYSSTYKVEFNSNNGKNETKTQTMTFNKSEKLNKNTFTKTGYVFKGWSTTPVDIENGANFVVYKDEQEVKNLANSNGTIIKLYAVWVDEEKPTAVITTTNDFNNIQTLTVKASDTGSGVKDILYSTKKTTLEPDAIYGTDTTYSVNDATPVYVYIRDYAGNVSEYGPINYYKTTFIQPDGCTVDMDMTNNYVLTANGSALTPSTYGITLPNATKEDCDFVGWNESATATNGVKQINPVTKSATYYPIFKAKNATLVNGVSFNTAIKQLVNTNANYTVEDNTITSIQYTNVKPSSGTLTVNVSQSGHEVLAYRNGGTIYLYSQAETIYYNPDSSYMFYNLKALSSLSITSDSKFKTTKTTNMSWMFEDCGYNNLTSLNLSIFDTSKVTNMEGMFADCGHEKMTSLNLGNNFNTSNVTNMKAMFANCGYKELTSLSLGSKFNTSKVTDMKAMLAYVGYMKMTSLNLGNNFDTSNVTDTSYMFAYTGHEKMTSLSLGSKFNCNKVTNMEWMFQYCGNVSMTSLDLTGLNVFSNNSTSASYEYMFVNCGKENSCSIKMKNDNSVTFVKNMNSDYLAGVNKLLITK